MTLMLALAFLVSQLFVFAKSIFSGFYEPTIHLNAEDYAGAWLVSKSRYMASKNSIAGISNLEGASFHLVRWGGGPGNYKTVMARDYLDFLVEHLSATTNQLPNNHPSIFEFLHKRLKRKVSSLKDRKPQYDEGRLSKTVAIMVYSSNAVSASGSIQNQIRQFFFESAFWSVHRYIPNIVIAVGSDNDLEIIKTSSLPIFNVIDLREQMKPPTNPHLLPKNALMVLHERLAKDPEYKDFQYVYYSEGDQVLHMRKAKEIYDVIDGSGGKFIVVPHRMQTLPLKKNFPERLQEYWPHDSNQNLPDAALVIENTTLSRGSCCDNGRFLFANCGAWWYNCKEYGLVNHTVWIKFGKSGFTMPLSTEHMGICSYSSTQKLCNIPDGCSESSRTTSISNEVCGEIPIVRKVGFKDGEKV